MSGLLRRMDSEEERGRVNDEIERAMAEEAAEEAEEERERQQLGSVAGSPAMRSFKEAEVDDAQSDSTTPAAAQQPAANVINDTDSGSPKKDVSMIGLSASNNSGVSGVIMEATNGVRRSDSRSTTGGQGRKESYRKKYDKNGNPVYDPPPGWERIRTRGNLAINLAVVGQWSSLLFLPAIYNNLTDALGFNSSQLGLLQTARLLAMFLSLPIFAAACYHFSRRLILTVTLCLSGVFCMLNATTYDYGSFMIVNIIAGFFLGSIVTVARSIIPNYYSLHERGEYFGFLELSSGIGGFIGAGCAVAITRDGYPIGAAKVTFEAQMAAMNLTWDSPATALANVSTLANGECCYPWQIVYLFIGLFMFPLAAYAYFFLTDPVMDRKTVAVLSTRDLIRVFPGLRSGYKMPSKKELAMLFTKGTFVMIVLQGCFGAFPWSGLSFLILWIQRMGVDEILAVVVFAAVGLGAAIGGLVGGIFGDLGTRSKYLGPLWGRRRARIMVSHTSVLFGIIYVPCLLQLIPYQASLWYVYAVVGGMMGLCIAWPPANNAALQSDVFPQHIHPTSYGMQYWMEGSVSALSPFVVGLLNDYAFGAKDLSPPGGQAEWNSFSYERQQAALKGMANSLTVVACCFWFVCSFFYCGMYYFYPRESMSLNPGKFFVDEQDAKTPPMGVKDPNRTPPMGVRDPQAGTDSPKPKTVTIQKANTQEIVEV